MSKRDVLVVGASSAGLATGAQLRRLGVPAMVVVGDDRPDLWAERGRRLTLHAEMEQVLGESGNGWMSVHELAREINERRLYDKRDGSDVDPSQIQSRANKYRHLFEKDGASVRLASS